jgi:hypothetical protein
VKIDGSCHCGNIRFEADVVPDKVVICHCTDCQTLSGSAFRTVVQTKPGAFKLISGSLKTYVKSGESGNRREQSFCPDCGTPIYSTPADSGVRAFSLRVGAIRQRDQLIPSDQYWFRSSQRWLQDMPTINKHDKQPVFEAKGVFGD